MTLRNLIRWALTSAAEKLETQFPEQQVSYLGKTANSFVYYPLGFHSNAPNQTLSLMMSVNGNSENRVIMPLSTEFRPEIEQGEVAIYHSENPSQQILFKNDGTIVVTGDTIINGNVTINGSLSTTDGQTDSGVNVGSDHKHSGVESGPSNTGNPI
jgi:hypothetical protein